MHKNKSQKPGGCKAAKVLTLDELKKRVHYSESIVEILPKLDLFLNGKLEKKRDDTFYNHYIHKEDTKKNILELVEKLMGS